MLLALTGGLATGKSTFAELLSARHPFVVFDADACVHELLAGSPEVIAAVTGRFGDEVLQVRGGIDRAALRRMVFGAPEARRDLEQILHPLVRGRWQEQIVQCRAAGRDLLAEIPLLFETGAERHFEETVLVAAAPDLQRQRLAARGLDGPTCEAMLASQLPISEKVARSSIVVWNDGTPAALAGQADLLLERLLSHQPCRT